MRKETFKKAREINKDIERLRRLQTYINQEEHITFSDDLAKETIDIIDVLVDKKRKEFEEL